MDRRCNNKFSINEWLEISNTIFHDIQKIKTLEQDHEAFLAADAFLLLKITAKKQYQG